MRGQRSQIYEALETCFQHMLRGEEEIEVGSSGLEAVQMAASSAQKLKDKFPKAFETIMDRLHTPEFGDWMRNSNPEDTIMDFSDGEKFDNELKAIHHLLAVKTFRPDRFVAAGERFIGAILGDSFRAIANSELDLAKIVNDQVNVLPKPAITHVHIILIWSG